MERVIEKRVWFHSVKQAISLNSKWVVFNNLFQRNSAVYFYFLIMCASMKFSVWRRAMCTQVDNSGKRIRPPLGIYGEFEMDIGSRQRSPRPDLSVSINLTRWRVLFEDQSRKSASGPRRYPRSVVLFHL